jgi:Tfp pilus assembly protein PilF
MKASNLFHQKNYRQSEVYFDKGFNAANGVEKAKFLFNKGLLLLKLDDKRPAITAFTETIKIDPSYSTRILSVLHPKR